jgi:hypothetical protein
MSESDKSQHWEATYSGISPLEISWCQGDDFKLVDEDSETHTTPTGAKQLFSYFHLQKTANP